MVFSIERNLWINVVSLGSLRWATQRQDLPIYFFLSLFIYFATSKLRSYTEQNTNYKTDYRMNKDKRLIIILQGKKGHANELLRHRHYIINSSEEISKKAKSLLNGRGLLLGILN